MSDPTSNPDAATKPGRSTIFAAALLLLALALVVIYTPRAAFLSPVAMVVLAAIGLAALMLQLRLRRDLAGTTRGPLWLNLLGAVCAIAAVFSDALHLDSAVMVVTALAAVCCFAISGIVVLNALRKHKA